MNLKFLITRSIFENSNITQRELASKFKVSLGKINLTIKELVDDNLIVKKDDDYAVVIMYNYSKIETIIDKNTFNSSIRTIASILSSIKYNDSVIGDNIGNDRKVFKEEHFDLFDSNIENENFLKYEEEYGTYKGQIDVNKDNDIIDVDETIE